MGVLDLASQKSIERGYEYFREKFVLSVEEIDEQIYRAQVQGSGDNMYDVTLNTINPTKSTRNCPHAQGRQIICKHKVATYFTLFPEETQEYFDGMKSTIRAAEIEEEEMYESIAQYVQSQ